MAPTQFVQVSDLAAHLPPPIAAGAVPAGATDDDSDATAPQAPAQTAGAAPGTADGPTVDVLPAKRIDPKPDPRSAAKLLAAADGKPKPAHHASPAGAFLPPHDGMLARGVPLPLAAPQPVGARVYSALAQKLPPSVHAPVVAAAPRYVAPYMASALAGRASLPPPTPYAGDQ
jgi:hypothetical protein